MRFLMVFHNHQPVGNDPRIIEQVAQTEAGFEMTCQGHGLVVAWPVRVSAGASWSVQIVASILGKE
jgi:hypothetical protein